MNPKMLGNNIHDSSMGSDDDTSYIGQAFALAFPSDVPREGRYMLILDTYFDESGTHAASDTVVMAGFLSTVDRWKRFEAEWKEALASYGLPFWHMTDFAAQVGSYAGWPEEMRVARLGHLLEIIARHTIKSYGFSAPKKLFETIFSEQAREFVGGPYSFVVMHCFMLVAAELQQLDNDAWVTHTLEDGAQGKGEVISLYDGLRKWPHAKDALKMLSLRFEGKERFVPLQAADILAYELYKEHPKQTDKAHVPRTPWRLLYTTPHTWRMFDEQHLRESAAFFEFVARMTGLGIDE